MPPLLLCLGRYIFPYYHPKQFYADKVEKMNFLSIPDKIHMYKLRCAVRREKSKLFDRDFLNILAYGKDWQYSEKTLPAIFRVVYFHKLPKFITREDMIFMTCISDRQILQLPLDMVKPNPYQPRRIFCQNALDELAHSIREYGVLQPISVRIINGNSYELVAGERRLRASRLAGQASIPAILVEINDLDSAVLAIIENLQRENLHFFEEAEGFRNLLGEYAFTQEALAARVGKNQSTIANKLRLLRLPRDVQKKIIESELSERHARAILKLENESDQADVLEKIISDSLTVRRTEDLIDAKLNAKKLTLTTNKKGKTIPFKAYIRDIRILTNTIQENLDIVRRSGMDARFDMQQTESGCNIFITLNYAQKREIRETA
jgi:ParB family chromosome partitioning protein